MAEFKDMLRYLRKSRNLSQSDLASEIGISTSTIAMYEVGERQPNFEIEEQLADFFNVSLDVLRGKESETRDNQVTAVRIPVLGDVAAGVPIDAIEDILDYDIISEELASTGEFFALRIKGDSMEPAICDSDIVIVRKQETAESGDIIIASLEGDTAVCKKLIKHFGGFMLISFNNRYQPIEFTEDNAVNCKVLGKVVSLRRKFD